MIFTNRGLGLALITGFALMAPLACSEGDDDAGTGTGAEGGAGSGGENEGGSDPGAAGDNGAAGDTTTPAAEGWTFDETIQGWAVGWAQTGQTGVEDATLKAGTTLTFDNDSGNPDPGSLLLEIPFTDPEQGVEVGINLPTPIDLSGKIITAKVRLNSGMLSNNLASAPGGAVLVVKTGENWVYGGSQWANISDNEWTTITLDVTSPSGTVNEGYDPALVRQIGVSIGNNGVVPEGATVQAASVQIDSIVY